jgi:C4-dicarboxylate transporter, DctQ subunit
MKGEKEMRMFMKTINSINRAMLWVVGMIIFLMGMALFYSVMMRYFFNSPQTWAFDLIGWGTGLAALLAGGYASLTKSHVRVDIFYDKFSPRTKSIVDVLTAFLWFFVSIILIWKGWEQVWNHYELNAISNTGLKVPVWTQWLMVPVGGMLLFLQEFVNFINNLFVIFTGKAYYEEIQEEVD